MLKEKQIIEALNKLKVNNDVEKYIKILDSYNDKAINVSTDRSFQKKYNNFYKIRHPNKEFYKEYYSLMQDYKQTRKKLSFIDTVKYFYRFGRMDASYVSKLLATINQHLPIWDKYVLQYFKLEPPRRPPSYLDQDKRRIFQEKRILLANDVYKEIIQRYGDLLVTNESKKCEKMFDEYYPENSITSIKKIDFIIWQTRG